MEHRLRMNVHFPSTRESELHNEMKRRAIAPWSAQPFDPFGRQPEDGSFYFHRDVVGDEPSCTVCIRGDKPGHWIIHAIVPDEGQPNPIPIQQCKNILSAFEAQIADPAVNVVEGMAAIEISEYRLDDYFSPKAVELLRRFCFTSNKGDLGSHLSDQEKWMEFLICAYDEGKDIHCDIFRYCLRTAGWWPEVGISKLVHEFDFAFRLLKQSER